MAASISPFQVNVADEAIDTLHKKLDLITWPDELEEAAWTHGVPLAEMKRLVDYWRNGFSWRSAEATINRDLPQFTTSIDIDGFGSLDIHFVHAQGRAANSIPLLFCHGWPGHFLEVRKLLPLLTADNGPAFHVVAPSLPNFGFSEGVKRKGFALPQYAEVCHKLMLALGYDQYVTQGGDWGYAVTRWMAMLFPAHVRASHSNMPFAMPPTLASSPGTALRFYLQYFVTGLYPEDRRALTRMQQTYAEGRGYLELQQTKPQTIAYSQTDSPLGLLAWVYEKLHDWTDGYAWTDDEVLTWVSIYVFSRSGAGAASRIYYEVNHDTRNRGRAFKVFTPNVKLGFSRFPAEIGGSPRVWLDALGEVVHWNEVEKGGHFAAYEVPDLLAKELKVMFGKDGGAYGCVPGKDGY